VTIRTRPFIISLTAAVVLAATPIGQRLALAGIDVYQRSVAPVAARVGAACRFAPTCSRYAEVAIARDGLLRGGWNALTRVARCNPWTPAGTVDEP
jgi:putative membrane protein insertion efficiency factor